MASRIMDRAGAVSPSGSVVSVATTATAAGMKRKERDFDGDAAGIEETNINVVVRCRGRNEREIRENSNVVVKCGAAKGKVVELLMGSNAVSDRSYNFDRVFSQAADQNMVFDDTVQPILEEVRLYATMLGLVLIFRCSPDTTAQSSPTDRPARERRTQCRAT